MYKKTAKEYETEYLNALRALDAIRAKIRKRAIDMCKTSSLPFSDTYIAYLSTHDIMMTEYYIHLMGEIEENNAKANKNVQLDLFENN